MSLKQGMKQASDLLMPENKDPEEALKAITETTMSLIARKQAKQVVDFRDAYDLIWGDYVGKWKSADTAGLQFGWPTLDEMSGGMARGDMISVRRSPATGQNLADALRRPPRLEQGQGQGVDPDHDQSRMFVSMEMAMLPISQRLAAMQTPVSADRQLKHGTVDRASSRS